MNNKYKTAIITKIEKETENIKTFTFDINVDGKPGQYIMVWMPRVNEKPFGLASLSPLTLTVSKVGAFTEKFHSLKKGDKISFRGPYGTSFKLKGKKILLVAGGYGIIPLYFFALNAEKKDRKKMTLVVGAKNKKQLIYIKRFNDLGVRVEISTDDGSKGFKGFSTQLAEKLMDEEKYDSVYTCGPTVMMQKVAGMCLKRKVFCQVSAEGVFKCGGIGLCGECSMNGILVCKEGTVFDAKTYLGK